MVEVITDAQLARQKWSIYLYNGNLWLSLLAAVRYLSRSEIRILAEKYSPEDPQTVWQLCHEAGLPIEELVRQRRLPYNFQKVYSSDSELTNRRRLLLQKVSFNYLRPPKDFVCQRMNNDVYSVYSFGALGLRLEATSDGNGEYEEWFRKNHIGHELADVIERCFERTFEERQQGLIDMGRYRILAGEYLMGKLFVQPFFPTWFLRNQVPEPTGQEPVSVICKKTLNA